MADILFWAAVASAGASLLVVLFFRGVAPSAREDEEIERWLAQRRRSSIDKDAA